MKGNNMDVKHGLSHGNLVLDHDGNVDIVVGYLGRIVHLVNYGPIDVQNIDPIPLTEDRLLKAGFEDWGIIDINQYEIEHGFVLHNVLDGTSSFKVCKQISNCNGIQYEEWVIKVDYDIIPFKRVQFIHDIQNCFYLISGIELTFTL